MSPCVFAKTACRMIRSIQSLFFWSEDVDSDEVIAEPCQSDRGLT